MHILVVYNPISGAKVWKLDKETITKYLRKKKIQADWVETTKEENYLDPYVNKQYDRIVISGGDGTVAQAAFYLYKHNLKTPLAIIPQGSANLLAMSLGIPLIDKMKALEVGLTKDAIEMDIMKINNKYIGIIAAGCGYDAELMHKTPRRLKKIWGFWAYLGTIFKTFFIYHGRPFKITVDGQRYQVRARSILAINLLPFADLPISKKILADEIKPNDGLLNVYVLNPRTLFNFLKKKKWPRFQVFRGKTIVIKQKKERKFQVDGEGLKAKTIKIELIPKAIRIAH